MAISYVAFVDPNFDFETRRQIAEDIIKYIQDRTAEGLGPGRRALGRYSNNYKDTREFQLAKAGETKVNLTLTGDMLSSIEILDISIAGRIEVGIDGGFAEEKAGYMLDKGYEFLSLTEGELEDIASNYEALSPETKEARAEIGGEFALEFIRSILGTR